MKLNLFINNRNKQLRITLYIRILNVSGRYYSHFLKDALLSSVNTASIIKKIINKNIDFIS